MKKKLLIAGVVLALFILPATAYNPFQILINFIAAGELPGAPFTLSPYATLMVVVAVVAAIALSITSKPSLLRLQPVDTPAEIDKPIRQAKKAQSRTNARSSRKSTTARRQKRTTASTRRRYQKLETTKK